MIAYVYTLLPTDSNDWILELMVRIILFFTNDIIHCYILVVFLIILIILYIHMNNN